MSTAKAKHPIIQNFFFSGLLVPWALIDYGAFNFPLEMPRDCVVFFTSIFVLLGKTEGAGHSLWSHSLSRIFASHVLATLVLLVTSKQPCSLSKFYRLFFLNRGIIWGCLFCCGQHWNLSVKVLWFNFCFDFTFILFYTVCVCSCANVYVLRSEQS